MPGAAPPVGVAPPGVTTTGVEPGVPPPAPVVSGVVGGVVGPTPGSGSTTGGSVSNGSMTVTVIVPSTCDSPSETVYGNVTTPTNPAGGV